MSKDDERGRILGSIRLLLGRDFAAEAALRESVFDEYSLVWSYARDGLYQLIRSWPDDDIEVPIAAAKGALQWPAYERYAIATEIERLFETGTSPILELVGAVSLPLRHQHNDNVDEYAEHFPNVRRLSLSSFSPEKIREVLGSSFAKQVTSLQITHQELSPEHIEAIASSSIREQLDELILHRSKLGAAGMQVLASYSWPQLQSLDLTHGHSEFDGAKALAHAEMPALKALRLREHFLPPEAVEYLLTHAKWMRQLQLLSFHYNELGARGAQALAKYPFKSLEVLSLSANEIGDEGLMAIANGVGMRNLRELYVEGNLTNPRITNVGMKAFAESTSMSQLERIDLGGNQFTCPSLVSVLASPNVSSLHTLNLSFAKKFDLSKATALQRATITAPLRRLDLTCCKVSDMDKLATLFRAVTWPETLVWLNLYGLKLDVAALTALCENQQTKHLKGLILTDSVPTSEFVDVLINTPFLQLEELELFEFRNPLEEESILRLIEAPWFPGLLKLRAGCGDDTECVALLDEACKKYGINLHPR